MVLSCASGADLRVSETRRDGRRLLEVGNAFYRLEIRPESGATISSLHFGRVGMAESTAWEGRSRSGLLQEAHTADVPFDQFRRRRTGGRLELGFRAEAGHLVVEKVFEFRADSPVIRLALRFENRSGCRLFGYDAPALRNLAAPAGREAPGTRYYSFDDGAVPRALAGATVLREANPAPAGELRWLAVTDPATRRGLGFIFPDRAPRGAAVRRNRRGRLLAGWSYPPLDPYTALETTALIVPLEGFAAVSELNERFAADTVPARDGGGAMTVSVRLMPLQEEMQEVSVVTRAYGSDGQELQPCEPILYEDVPAWRTVAGRIELPPEEKEPAWLLHEVYSRGEKLGQFLGRVTGGANPPRLPPPSRPEGRFVDLESQARPGKLEATEAEMERGFLLCTSAPGRERRLDEPISLRLFSSEWETIFVGFRALTEVEELRASLTAGESRPGSDADPLPAAAGYLWSVQEERSPATLEPFGERGVTKGDLHWLAITLDASQLETGAYAGRLYVEADGKDAEIPLKIRVSGVDLLRHEGFALWHLGSEGEEPLLAQLADRGVSAAAVAFPRPGGTAAVRRLMQEAGPAGLGLLSFLAPGRGAGVAGRLGAGVAGSGLLPAGPPAWVLWQGADSPEAPQSLRELGYAPALLADRLTGLKGSPLWRGTKPDRWLVRNGCRPGAVPELISAGWIRPTDNVWSALDLRGSTWIDAACRLREVFWAGAWQGLSGAAVRLPARPADDAPQVALWHVLRDAREEAAACAVALGRGRELSAKPEGEETDPVRRARLLANLEDLVGERSGSPVRIEHRRTAYRRLPRAVAGEESKPGGPPAYRQVRNRAVELLEEADRIDPPPATTSNLYWRGTPLVRDGAMHWAIWAPQPEKTRAQARGLRQTVKERTGWELADVEEYPAARDLSLLWVFGGGSMSQNLPEVVRGAGVEMRAGEVRTVSLEDGTLAVLVGEEVTAEALDRCLLPAPTLYRPALGVK